MLNAKSAEDQVGSVVLLLRRSISVNIIAASHREYPQSLHCIVLCSTIIRSYPPRQTSRIGMRTSLISRTTTRTPTRCRHSSPTRLRRQLIRPLACGERFRRARPPLLAQASDPAPHIHRHLGTDQLQATLPLPPLRDHSIRVLTPPPAVTLPATRLGRRARWRSTPCSPHTPPARSAPIRPLRRSALLHT